MNTNLFRTEEQLNFTETIPASVGFYLCIEKNSYNNFIENPTETQLDGLEGVFVKKTDENELYAINEEVIIPHEDFDFYVWVFKAEMN